MRKRSHVPAQIDQHSAQQVKLSLSAVLYQRLQTRAREAGVPMAAYLRYLILKDLEGAIEVSAPEVGDQIPDSLIEQALKKDPNYYLGDSTKSQYQIQKHP